MYTDQESDTDGFLMLTCWGRGACLPSVWQSRLPGAERSGDRNVKSFRPRLSVPVPNNNYVVVS